MKLIIFIIMVCGQPDTVAIIEQGGEPYAYHSEHLQNSRALQQDLYDKLRRDDSTVVVVKDERGMCT